MVHRIDDNLLVTATLQRRLKDEAANLTGNLEDGWWCCVQRSNGEIVQFSYGYTADFAESRMAFDLIGKLNRAIHHDGCWLAQWLLEGKHLNVIWIDKDGDPQFTIEFADDAAGIASEPLLVWIDQCEEAWTRWHHSMKTVLAPSPEQLFKKALGEESPSAKQGKIILPDRLNRDFDINL